LPVKKEDCLLTVLFFIVFRPSRRLCATIDF